MMTGGQYKNSLDDGRATYFEGERVTDLPGHPILGLAVNEVATVYDRFYSPDEKTSPLMVVPLMETVRV